MSRTFSRTARPWTWSEQQYVDPHTTFLLDLSVESQRAPADDGLRMGNAAGGDLTPWAGSSKITEVAGKFRQGLQANTASNGVLTVPGVGIFAPSFTWEMWVAATGAWSGLSSQAIMAYSNSLGGDNAVLEIDGGKLLWSVSSPQRQSANISETISVASGLPIDTAYHWVAVTFDAASGTLKLLLDGAVGATQTGIVMPGVFGDAMRDGGNGLILCGGPGVTGSTSISLSDLRISRIARTLGKPAPLVAL